MSAPDCVILNGNVITMDPACEWAQAVAVTGGRITALGSNDDLRVLAGPNTKVIDAAGGTVMPGFVESHMHLFVGAAELDHLQLAGVHGFAALKERALAYQATRRDAPILIAQGADYTILNQQALITRQDLDAVIRDQPFALTAPDHHTMWANTIALERAGILHGRSLRPGNEIVIGEDGLATGELRESEAMGPVLKLSGGDRAGLGLSTGGEPDPAPTARERAVDLAVMRRGLAHAAAHGITSIHNMDGNYYQLELLEEIERAGDLRCRVRVPFHFKNFMQLSELEKASDMARRWRGARLCSGFVKVFYDGVLDSGTAVLIDDYADRPGWRGEPIFTQEQFSAIAVEADRRGLQIAVHAIGDGAVHAVLNGYEAARKANGARDARHRIEHIEVVSPRDVSRFKELGVLASMQPPHPPGSAGLPLEPTISRIGEQRWPYAYAWRTLAEAGATLVFATDWPVSPIDPIASIQCAMMRQPWAAHMPDQRIPFAKVIEAYTANGAYAEFAEDRKGRLRAGMSADMVILSGNIAAAPPEELHTIRPVLTMCDGAIAFDGEGREAA